MLILESLQGCMRIRLGCACRGGRRFEYARALSRRAALSSVVSTFTRVMCSCRMDMESET